MRILVADDDGLCRKMIEDTLVRWGYEVVTASDGAEAWRVLQTDTSPRLVILDWLMPGMDGLEICRELRKLPRDLYTYVLLLTARSSRKDLLAGLDAGADDYLVKPVDENELRVRLRTAMRILDLQEFLVSGREALKVQATHDPLTNLSNRGDILGVLAREMSRAERVGTKVAVLLADIDNFKGINDTYGHLVGDAALREVARRMRATVRPYDGVGRYGGDEFLIVLPGCDTISAVAVAERIRQSCSSKAIDAGGHSLTLSLSIGGTVGSELMENEVEPIIAAADASLYRAKAEGRNRVFVSRVGVGTGPSTGAGVGKPEATTVGAVTVVPKGSVEGKAES